MHLVHYVSHTSAIEFHDFDATIPTRQENTHIVCNAKAVHKSNMSDQEPNTSVKQAKGKTLYRIFTYFHSFKYFHIAL